MKRIRKKVDDYFHIGSQFRHEFRKQMRLLIIVTIGFTIAFTWRQTIFDGFLALTKAIFNIQGEVSASILTSILITIVSVLIILLTSRFLQDRPSTY